MYYILRSTWYYKAPHGCRLTAVVGGTHGPGRGLERETFVGKKVTIAASATLGTTVALQQ